MIICRVTKGIYIRRMRIWPYVYHMSLGLGDDNNLAETPAETLGRETLLEGCHSITYRNVYSMMMLFCNRPIWYLKGFIDQGGGCKGNLRKREIVTD